jgi:hypothetical protein
MRKFDITSGKKLAFHTFFCYDSPVNVAAIHFQLNWRDVDHALNHVAAYRYNTFLQQHQYLPNTTSSPSGAFTALANANTTMASGAGTWHDLYFDIDFGAGNYDEFYSGQIGIGNPGNTGLLIPTFTEQTEWQRMELLVGVESTASGAGNAWFADPIVYEVD